MQKSDTFYKVSEKVRPLLSSKKDPFSTTALSDVPWEKEKAAPWKQK